jgi:hypothetical protein
MLRKTNATVIALWITSLLLVGSGSALALTVGSSSIKDNSIQARDIANGAVKGGELAGNTVTWGDLHPSVRANIYYAATEIGASARIDVAAGPTASLNTAASYNNLGTNFTAGSATRQGAGNYTLTVPGLDNTWNANVTLDTNGTAAFATADITGNVVSVFVWNTAGVATDLPAGGSAYIVIT